MAKLNGILMLEWLNSLEFWHTLEKIKDDYYSAITKSILWSNIARLV